MLFSQRIGKSSVRTEIQIDSMDARLKNRLFNVVKDYVDTELAFWDSYHYIKHDFIVQYCDCFGNLYVGDDYNSFFQELNKKVFIRGDIFFFYDFIEFMVGQSTDRKEILIHEFNRILGEEKSAYKFDVNGSLIQITDDTELEEIDLAIENVSEYRSVQEHLEKARGFFSSREYPDYKKSIEESIHAVEAMSRLVIRNKNATLSDALKKISGLHPALNQSLQKLYAFAGDAGGIRHSNKEHGDSEEEYSVGIGEARMILVLSHSVINYLKEKFL